MFTNKKKNKISTNTNCEFGYELQLVIPYAYYLHKNNLLDKTTSSKFTNELYYFSKNHQQLHDSRICIMQIKNIPNPSPHVKELNYDKYIPPPYKLIYKNDFFVYDKPLLIIHNKFNSEWGMNPINFIDVDTLEKIFNLLNNKYTIIYLRPKSKYICTDHGAIKDLNESHLFDLYNIIDGSKLYDETKQKYNINNFNHFQLLIHSNCNHFISVQGGNSVIASYFGGTNIIYARAGNELDCNSYNTHYKKYSNCDVLHANNYTDFIELIENKFLTL